MKTRLCAFFIKPNALCCRILLLFICMATAFLALNTQPNTQPAKAGEMVAESKSYSIADIHSPMNSGAWSALANYGLNGDVYAIAQIGDDIYVGGNFSQTWDGAVTNLNYIARYNNGTWYPLHNNGLSGRVNALAVVGDVLYVGGNFSMTADGSINLLKNIAKYVPGPTGGWQRLARYGVGDEVWAITPGHANNDIYVGGAFTYVADDQFPLWRIARYDGSEWYQVGDDLGGDCHGLDYHVYDMLWWESTNTLVVGGAFTNGCNPGGLVDLHRIAFLNGNTWVPLANNGLNNNVRSLALIGDDLYVGGHFTKTKDDAVTGLGRIARYTNNAWSPLARNGLGQYNVRDMVVYQGDLYVGGEFIRSADGLLTLNNIARYSGETWYPLANNGLNYPVRVLSANTFDLFVGGEFTGSKDNTLMTLKRIARYNAPLPYRTYLPIVIK